MKSLKTIARKYSIAWIAAVTLLLLPFTNCGSPQSGGGSSAASSGGAQDNTTVLANLRARKNHIFTTHCAGCHYPGATDNPLTDILNTDFLDDRGYINPGSPQTSPLYLSIIDQIMPPGGATMSTDEIAAIRDWIAAEGGNFNTYIGGSPSDPGTGGSNTPFTPVRTVLRQNCTACHRSGGTAPNLDVDAPTLRAAVFNGQRLVIPGNPNGSLLLQSFGSMPQGAPLGVNSNQANAIRTWIANGAQ